MRARAHRALGWVAALAGCVAACQPKPSPSAAVEAGAATPGAASTSSPAPVASFVPRRPKEPPLPCRVIALEGKASVEAEGAGGVDGGLLALQDLVPSGWVTLGDATRLVAKDPRTTRETTFHGPGRLRDCIAGTEEAWVGLGSFESTAGAGETPGAEEWVVTPHAVVRYAAAKLRVGVHPTGTTVTMVAGVAFMWPPAMGANAAHIDEGWQRLPVGDTTAPPEGPIGGAVDRCSLLADRAHELTVALFSSDAGPSNGPIVTDQVTTRRLARAACAVAEVRASTTPAGERTDAAASAWAARLAEAGAAWRSLPSLPASAPSP